MINSMAYANDIFMQSTGVRILVVADEMLARAGLASLLTDQRGVKVVGQADGKSLEGELEIYQPDILVWDVGMGGVLSVFPDDVPAIALVADGTVASQVRGLGVEGVLPRDASPKLIVSAMTAVMQGLVVVDPSFAAALSTPRAVSDSSEQVGQIDVTPRELEVLRQLAQGTSNKAIAYELDISEHTVKFHVNSLMTKLDARNRTEAVVIATRTGLIPL